MIRCGRRLVWFTTRMDRRRFRLRAVPHRHRLEEAFPFVGGVRSPRELSAARLCSSNRRFLPGRASFFAARTAIVRPRRVPTTTGPGGGFRSEPAEPPTRTAATDRPRRRPRTPARTFRRSVHRLRSANRRSTTATLAGTTKKSGAVPTTLREEAPSRNRLSARPARNETGPARFCGFSGFVRHAGSDRQDFAESYAFVI